MNADTLLWLLYGCVWILQGLWANKIAVRNGRNGHLWLLNGLIFGWFAVIAALILGKSEDRKIEDAAKRVFSSFAIDQAQDGGEKKKSLITHIISCDGVTDFK